MTFENIIIYLLVVIFSIGFVVNVTGPNFVRNEFYRWGLPQWLRLAIGIIEGVIALFLFLKLWVLATLVTASLIMTSAVLIVLYNQEMRRALVPFFVLILVLTSISEHILTS